MHNRIIRMAAVACTLSILIGCTAKLDPVQEGTPISFISESPLLMSENVTKVSLTDQFVAGSTFSVFGNRVVSDEPSDVFDNTGATVTAYDPDNDSSTPLVWRYSPLRSWLWESTGDWYDFVGISPAGKGSAKMNISGNLAVSTHYSLSSDNYDILGSAYRRRGNVPDPFAIVPMAFSHLGSAVIIRVMNNSASTDVTLKEVKYKNLVVEGDAKVTLDTYANPEKSWINTERSRGFVRTSAPDLSIEADDSYDCSPEVMIPQRLDQAAAAGNSVEDMPALYLYYTPDGSTQKEAIIRLKDICPRDSDIPITSWSAGTKYIYEISIRLDGGVLVTVETTDWGEIIEAETPGLLIQ